MSQKASKQHSHIAARNFRPMDLKNASAYRQLSRMGIVFDDRRLREMHAVLGAPVGTMDSAALQPSITTASVTTPLQFLQEWLPGFVHVITQARNIDELIGLTTVGSWEDEEVVQGTMERTGTSNLYGDETNVPLSSWNTNFERRSVVRFEEGMRVGNLEEARAARIRMNSAEAKREAASLALEIRRNQIGFYGFNGGTNRTYGFLNDPTIPAYGSVSGGTWASKTFLQITADIRTAVAALRVQSGDNISPQKVPMTLAIATAAVDYLSTVSDFGISVQKWLTDTYPKIRVVSAPELDAASGGENVFYLFAEQVEDTSTDNGRVFDQIVPAKFMVLGVAKTAKGYEEDYSNASAGVLCKRPYAVVRYAGI